MLSIKKGVKAFPFVVPLSVIALGIVLGAVGFGIIVAIPLVSIGFLGIIVIMAFPDKFFKKEV